MGSHVGTLWSNGGTLLARATFTDETPAGWQQVTFSRPVAITGQHHLRRVVSRAGRRLCGDAGLSSPTSGARDAALQALADQIDGRNGVFALSGAPTFPTQFATGSFAASNYWVDVTFDTAVDIDGDGSTTKPTTVRSSPTRIRPTPMRTALGDACEPPNRAPTATPQTVTATEDTRGGADAGRLGPGWYEPCRSRSCRTAARRTGR